MNGVHRSMIRGEPNALGGMTMVFLSALAAPELCHRLESLLGDVPHLKSTRGEDESITCQRRQSHGGSGGFLLKRRPRRDDVLEVADRPKLYVSRLVAISDSDEPVTQAEKVSFRHVSHVPDRFKIGEGRQGQNAGQAGERISVPQKRYLVAEDHGRTDVPILVQTRADAKFAGRAPFEDRDLATGPNDHGPV